jgi:hypothetical protein
MLWLVAALLVLQVSAKGGAARRYTREYAACKDDACRKKVMKMFNQDSKLRVRTLRAEENVRAELKLAKELKKCSKLEGGDRDKCLWDCRLSEVRRKGSMLRRVLHEHSNAGLKACKSMKKKKAQKKCKKAMEFVHHKEIVRLHAREVQLIGDYSVADVIEEVKYTNLLPESSKCVSAHCQLNLAARKCPQTEPGRKACIRVVLLAPVNTGSNKYLKGLQEKFVKCKDDEKCMDKEFHKFRKETEIELESYTRLRTVENRAKFAKAVKACNGKAACLNRRRTSSLRSRTSCTDASCV